MTTTMKGMIQDSGVDVIGRVCRVVMAMYDGSAKHLPFPLRRWEWTDLSGETPQQHGTRETPVEMGTCCL